MIEINGKKFSDFMQEALYGDEGFYIKGNGAGRNRDYLTSPEVGDLFGRVIADYIERWFNSVETEKANIIEVGSGPGSLAASIARSGKDWLEQVNYTLVEISPIHRETSNDKLSRINSKLKWQVLEKIPNTDGSTLVIANELFDNLIFDIDFTHNVYDEYIPDRLNIHEAMARFGIFGNIDLAENSNVSSDIDNYLMPIHVGINNWLGELEQSCSNVASLQLLIFDYIKPIKEMSDGNWLRLYNENKRIVGVQKVIEALKNGTKGDITADIVKEDLMLALDLNGFSKITYENQSDWLERNGINNYISSANINGYDQLQQFIGGTSQIATDYSIERNLLMDVNGLGAFGVVSAKREI